MNIVAQELQRPQSPPDDQRPIIGRIFETTRAKLEADLAEIGALLEQQKGEQ